MKRLKIKHLTEYVFSSPVTLQQHCLLIRPREGHDLRIESSLLTISPSYHIHWSRDVFDNSLATVTFLQPSDKLTIASEVVIQHYEEAPFDFWMEAYATNYPFAYAQAEWADLAAYQRLIFEPDGFRVNQWLQQLGLLNGQRNTVELLNNLNQAIYTQFRYQAREAPGVQAPATTLNNGSGSCRDYATLFIEACRNLGLASRFVSGYLHAPATEAGNATTHAWAEVYLPGTGWKGFDPTSGQVTGTQHIAVAVARDPESVPPVAGSFIGPNITPALHVNVQVNLLTA
ncbi:transglutaminase family protein [Methylophilus sp.]|jgi:transglutaminase-like putative cysteine protease|uniref:transglutaminase family protein n=1 Tax=Methylophilus sp. TaxID=29541 RepID=UPI0011D779EE|nr:transglutaminase family protein [Methylophilus sp.]TXI44440.1 MAG: transglutaminase family protein [Methylophilus sp.]